MGDAERLGERRGGMGTRLPPPPTAHPNQRNAIGGTCAVVGTRVLACSLDKESQGGVTHQAIAISCVHTFTFYFFGETGARTYGQARHKHSTAQPTRWA